MDDISVLKERIEELTRVIHEHAKILDNAKGLYSPYLDKDIEELQHLRAHILK